MKKNKKKRNDQQIRIRIEIFWKFHSYFHTVCTIVNNNNNIMSGAFILLKEKKLFGTCGFRFQTKKSHSFTKKREFDIFLFFS